MRSHPRRLTAPVVVLVALGALWAGIARDANAANRVHAYSFTAVNYFSSTPTDGATFYFTGRTVAPAGAFGPVDVVWARVYPAQGGNAKSDGPIWTLVNWSGLSVPMGGSVFFSHGIRVKEPPSPVPTQSFCWARWTIGGSPAGAPIYLGWRFNPLAIAARVESKNPTAVASTLTPSLYNAPSLPDGSPNAGTLTVRDLQFAMAPEGLFSANLVYDDPEVVSLFNSSADAVRPGPLTVAPGGVLGISVDPSITDPVGGQAVLARGTLEVETGRLINFVFQLSNEVPVPGVSPWSLSFASLALAALAVAYLRRRSGDLTSAA